MEDKQIYTEKKKFNFKELLKSLTKTTLHAQTSKPSLPPKPVSKVTKNINSDITNNKTSPAASTKSPEIHKENSDTIYVFAIYLLFFAIIAIIVLAIVFAKK